MLMPQHAVEVQFTYTGVNTFPINFPFYDKTSIKLSYKVTAIDIEIPTDFVYNVDYTVSGVLATDLDNTNAYTSGSVALTVAGAAKLQNGYLVIMVRSTEAVQLFQYNELDNFPAKSHENALSRLAAGIQEVQQALKRAVILPPASTENPLDLTVQIFQARDDTSDFADAAAASAQQAKEFVDSGITELENNKQQAISDIEAKTLDSENRLQAQVDEATNQANIAATKAQESATSETNAKASEELARQYAESAAQAGSIASDETYELGISIAESTNPKQVKGDINKLKELIDTIPILDVMQAIRESAQASTIYPPSEKAVRQVIDPITESVTEVRNTTNTKLNSTGGTINGHLVVTGNLTVNGVLSCSRFILAGKEIQII